MSDLNNSAQLHSSWKDHARALELYNRAIELEPTDAVLYYNRGMTYYDMRDYEAAEADFTRAIELNPNDADFYSQRAVVRRRDDVESALKDLQRAIDIDSTDYFPFMIRAGIHTELGRRDEALRDYNKAIKNEPNNPGLYSRRATFYRSMLKRTEAIADLTKLLSLRPDDLKALQKRANLFIELRQFDKAVSDFNTGIRLHPGDASAWFSRGMLLLRLGQTRQALQDLNRVVALQPNESYYRGGMAKVQAAEQENKARGAIAKQLTGDLQPGEILLQGEVVSHDPATGNLTLFAHAFGVPGGRVAELPMRKDKPVQLQKITTFAQVHVKTAASTASAPSTSPVTSPPTSHVATGVMESSAIEIEPLDPDYADSLDPNAIVWILGKDRAEKNGGSVLVARRLYLLG